MIEREEGKEPSLYAIVKLLISLRIMLIKLRIRKALSKIFFAINITWILTRHYFLFPSHLLISITYFILAYRNMKHHIHDADFSKMMLTEMKRISDEDLEIRKSMSPLFWIFSIYCYYLLIKFIFWLF